MNYKHLCGIILVLHLEHTMQSAICLCAGGYVQCSTDQTPGVVLLSISIFSSRIRLLGNIIIRSYFSFLIQDLLKAHRF